MDEAVSHAELEDRLARAESEERARNEKRAAQQVLQGAAGWWLIECTYSPGHAESRGRRAVPMARIDVEERDSRVLVGWTYDARSAVDWVDTGAMGSLCVYHSIPVTGG